MSNLPEEKRKRRLSLLAKKVRESTEPADLSRLTAWACLNWGCKQETAAEYLQVLQLAGLVEIDSGMVRWSGGE